uniref:Chemokine interleukin-8-like domain-containing protein n=1 Tax=Nothobranchius furzeri TaxID=105023 RepID=A0A8C6LFA5_NOTFU
MTGLPFIPVLLVAVLVPMASTHGGTSNCCLKIKNTRVNQDRLKSYYIQDTPSCTLKAVVFVTKKDKRICGSLRDRWTQKRMAYLDERKVQPTTRHSLASIGCYWRV